MPRLAKVGDGWGGSEDYATLALWWAAESGVDYGSAIEAQCKGYLGAVVDISGSAVHGAKIYTDSVTYNGANGDLLAKVITLTVGADNTEVYDLHCSSNSVWNRSLVISLNMTVGTFDRLFCSSDVPDGQYGIFRIDCQSNNVHVRNIVIDANNCKDGLDFRYADYAGTLENVTIINYLNRGLLGSNAHTSNKVFATGGVNGDFNNFPESNTNSASGDASGVHTGYTKTELVDPDNGDYRVKLTSSLHALNIGAFFEAAASQTHQLIYNKINIACSIESIQLTRITNIGFNDLTIQSTIDNFSLVRKSTLAFDDVFVGSQIDNMSVIKYSSLLFNDIAIGSQIDNLALTRYSALIFDELIINSTIDNMELSTTGNKVLQFNSVNVGCSIESLTLSRNATLQYHDLSIASTIDNMNLSGNKALQFNSVSVGCDIDNITLVRKASLQFDEPTVSSEVEHIALTRYTALSFDDLTVVCDIESLTMLLESMPDIIAGSLNIISATLKYHIASNTPQFTVAKGS
ncbi:hypothetical protein tloyanaT_12950 [Thalassotalea loyana]|uniref:Right-handed parallel beta-helix repeat-containing protein n=1 Tax=Thalassotalea loyana TaxID=280483 RepID=A0ABQ6HA95_9GAMM|nr:hypothetical protein [Thalassotalea loyana]GLX85043.1 hypothetical protein tloyanaT_12950 [Thalassotalea loyana]